MQSSRFNYSLAETETKNCNDRCTRRCLGVFYQSLARMVPQKGSPLWRGLPVTVISPGGETRILDAGHQGDENHVGDSADEAAERESLKCDEFALEVPVSCPTGSGHLVVHTPLSSLLCGRVFK